MTTSQYVESISNRYSLGNATEHTFRGDLQQLIESLVPTIRATNEPKRQDCGAPDYILTRGDIDIGFIEAKYIGDTDLHGSKKKSGNKEQFDRYKGSLGNLIFTDYLTFHLYHDGQFVTTHKIGEITEKGIVPLSDAFQGFEAFIKDFCTHIGQTITSSKRLAEIMAGKARLLSDVIEKSLVSDESRMEDSTLKDQMKAFKEILIHDITPKGFADVYAQTIAYGMFAARLHDSTLPTFSRSEAAELIPKSNPFLRKLFGYIAGPEIDDRIKWIVDSLVDIFLHCNVEELLRNYGKATKMEDPIIHFYETFLSEYDPKLRKDRGVWYTPKPVVDFIVRAVDDILKSEFGLPRGLADNSKIQIKIGEQGKKVEKEFHKVQILDPAAGTGTFLAEVVKYIHKKFDGQQGIWSNYVDSHLLPRLNGFEILMASYAMAHLKLDLLLTETGYKPTTNQRFRVFLTNSLEESHPETGTLFANWLSEEANQANHIKRDTPVMCIIGNPPYNGISSNNGKWISTLINDYKYVDGVHFNERKHWLNDDYVKFIRLGEFLIEKNASGVLAFINPHGFLNNPTFRGMRWRLLQTYDDIYTIDLHGNSIKKEKSPDGGVDENVFGIKQGVSINIFVKKSIKKSKMHATIHHHELFGNRDSKYDFLSSMSLSSIPFKKLEPSKPNLFFVPASNTSVNDYEKGFSVNDLFGRQSMGVTTARDHLVIDMNKDVLIKRMRSFFDPEIDDYSIRGKVFGSKKVGKYLPGDTRGWKLIEARKAFRDEKHESHIKLISYRPFDKRYIYYNRGMVDWGREDVMRNMSEGNVALVCVKIGRNETAHNFFITDSLADKSLTSSLDNSNIFPLYIRSENSRQKSLDDTDTRVPNLNNDIVKAIALKLGLSFTYEKESNDHTIAPIDILDYVYAVLHSPTYRETFKEFLKIDFPRVPHPKDSDTFWKMVKLGGEIRQLHLLKSPTVERYITQYPVDGDNLVEKPTFLNGRVYINETQYFDYVPSIAWEFYIGGYQPAQKWLKDRKGRHLEFNDILHYQKMIVSLTETDRLMKEIDNVGVV